MKTFDLNIFKSESTLLSRLGFQLVEDDPSSALKWSRDDNFSIYIIAERYEEAFSLELQAPDVEIRGALLPDCLMDAIDPVRAAAAREVIRTFGTGTKGALLWWREFLNFLCEREAIVFANPMDSAVRAKYDAIYQKTMRDAGLWPESPDASHDPQKRRGG